MMEAADNSSEFISECYEHETDIYYKVFSTIVKGYLTVLCVILGTVGNLQGIRRVQAAHLDKNRGVVLAVSMLALAFWDTLLLWGAFFYYGLTTLFPSTKYGSMTLLVPYAHGLTNIANTASIWCVAVITIQRFMATRDPFRTSRSVVVMQSFRSERRISFIYCSSYRRLFRMPLILASVAIIFNIPTFFELRTVPCYSVVLNRTTVVAVPADLRFNKMYSFGRAFFRMIFVSIGPNVFILCVTLVTVFILRGSNRSRRQLFQMADNLLERYASRENIQTLLAIMIAVKFLLLRSLVFVMDIIEVTIGFKNNYTLYFIDISNFLVIINSATNCMIYLKGSEWLNTKFVDRQTIKRKKTICDSGQLLGDRLSILCLSWDKTMEMTNGELGTRIAWNMLRKHPTMFNNIKSDEPEKVSLLNGSCKRSIDHVKLREIGNRITSFISELLDLMKNSQTEDVIICRIRRVGAVHYDRGITFSSSIFKEFKNTIQTAIAECQYASPQERDAALESWNIFVSFIIREMKMGTWVMGDNVNQMP